MSRSGIEQNSLYGVGARTYERHADSSLYNSGYERPAMLEIIGDVSGLRILDAGSAAGYYTAALSGAADSVVAVDRSAAMVDRVLERGLGNVTAHVHDLAEPLAWLPSASLDLVVTSLTLHYVQSWDVAMREFHRILVPGGRLVLSTHHPAMTAPLVEDYFAVQAVTDSWDIEGVATEVSFFHRPLQAILAPFVQAGFRLGRVVEPHLAHRNDASEAERRLAVRPWFLIVEAVRPIEA